jgi:hypothetical protein
MNKGIVVAVGWAALAALVVRVFTDDRRRQYRAQEEAAWTAVDETSRSHFTMVIANCSV